QPGSDRTSEPETTSTRHDQLVSHSRTAGELQIEACFVSQRSPGDLYLFKGSEVAEVDSGGDKLRWGPTSIAEWRPAYPFDSNINACFVDLRSPGDLYMFRGKYVCLVDADGDGVRKGRQTVASWRSQYLF
ncbi:hypothetical protein, partial [Streptomyces sp. NPDC090021]|uniref:hypothetical protein n=1 Tax=Streptomyces sp. NPDC090021 TaxID=3365919 RepID=UPI0038258040